ncbi:methylmalonyl-CoA mutase family protein, partial [Streptomyces halstedii]
MPTARPSRPPPGARSSTRATPWPCAGAPERRPAAPPGRPRERVPRWNPINICSYHLQEAGATPVQEIAY